MQHTLRSFLFFALILTAFLTRAQVTKLCNNCNIRNGFPLGSVAIVFSDSNAPDSDSLWRTDGTPGGTVKFADNVSVNDETDVILYMGKLFFTGINAANGKELWVSDATAPGTFLVKDIEVGSGSSVPRNFFVFNGALYFFANTTANGVELWKSNGTESGTVLVEDINPGAASSWALGAGFLTNQDSTILYFLANNGANGTELWKTDGTEPGTMIVKDINPGPASSKPLFNSFSYIGFGSDIIFSADDGTLGAELWKSNGTDVGTVLLKDIYTDFLSSSPGSFLFFNSKLYFVADAPGYGRELWVTDGTTAGTTLVKDIDPGIFSSNPNLFLSVFIGGKFYFTARTQAEGVELWSSDGTSGGTQILKDINPGPANGFPLILINFLNLSSFQDARGNLYGGKIFLSANDGTHGNELWITDGTTARTTMVKDLYAGSPSGLGDFFSFGSYFYSPFGLVFTADEGLTGMEPWRSDSTESGTIRITDINPGADSSSPQFIFVFNSRLLFRADDGDNINGDRDLFRLDLALSTPIYLLDFTASPQGKSAHLKWTTAEEINSSYFEIEKSTDGRQFKKIGSMTAATNSSQKKSYEFVDPDAFSSGSKQIFYRLRMVDIDARFSYSKIAILNSISALGSLHTYPNPAGNRLVIVINSGNATKSEIRIIDQQGKQVYNQQVNTLQGANQYAINIAYLSKGVYYLQLLTDNGTSSVKFIKN